MVILPLIACCPLLGVSGLPAHGADPLPPLRAFAELPAVTGAEQALLRRVETLLPTGADVQRDVLGSLVVRPAGARGPVERLVLLGVDEPGYVVSRIRDDGLLRLRGVGIPRSARGYHLDREGRPVRVLTRGREIPGVVMIHSVHLGAPRPETISERDLWVDVGADSPAEAAAMGVELLDPVVSRDVTAYGGGRVAGPELGRRAILYATLTVLRASPDLVRHDELAFAFVTQSLLDRGPLGRGGAAVLRQLAPRRVLVLGRTERDDPEPRRRTTDDAEWRFLDLPVTHPGSPVETVERDELQTFAAALLAILGGEGTLGDSSAGNGAVGEPAPAAGGLPTTESGDPGSRRTHAEAAAMLRRIVLPRGVSGHEGPVRAAVLRAVREISPALAPKTDSEGNVVLRLGRGDRSLAFVAHMDEVGLEVTQIRSDGLLEMRRRGGFFGHTWRSKPVELSTAAGVRSGIALPEAEEDGTILVDVGARSAAQAAELGVAPGDPVSDPKQLMRLGAHRAAGRALDDRVGCSALLLALRRLAPDIDALDREIVLAWVVREEIGLEGADHLARTLRPVPQVVFPVDTFVSSDNPRDDPYYAYAPLGQGPVLRAIDSTSIVPRDTLDAVRAIADRHGLALQAGVVSGGNDGSRFLPEGAIDCPLAWPQRNSHTRVETLDLRDLERLAQLVSAIAKEF